MYKVVGAEPNPDQLPGEADIYVRAKCEILVLHGCSRAIAVPLLPSLLPPAHLRRTEVRETTAVAVTGERCWEALSLQGLGHGGFTPSSSTPVLLERPGSAARPAAGRDFAPMRELSLCREPIHQLESCCRTLQSSCIF